MENKFSLEQRFELNMELNGIIEYIDELYMEQRVLNKRFVEAYNAKHDLMLELGIKNYDVT